MLWRGSRYQEKGWILHDDEPWRALNSVKGHLADSTHELCFTYCNDDPGEPCVMARCRTVAN
jgi:hypothetical protein